MHKNDVHDHINEPYDKIVEFVKKVNFKNSIKILKSFHKNHSNVELQSNNDILNLNFVNNTYEKLKIQKKSFIYECKNENINLPNQCKGKNIFLDMVIDIHNPLSSKLTNIHNSIRNEMLIKFKFLSDLHIKAFDEFIIDLRSSNFKENK
jgi:hypothetical protein